MNPSVLLPSTITASRIVLMLLLIAVMLGAVSCAFDQSGQQPTAFAIKQGEKFTVLRGMWKFRDGDDPTWGLPTVSDDAWETTEVPGYWSSRGEISKGIGWYRAWIDVPEKMEHSSFWGISSNGILTAAEVYWDGALVARHGIVGNSAETEVPGASEYVYILPEEYRVEGRHLLAIRISNHHAFTGGMIEAPLFGSYKWLSIIMQQKRIWNGIVVGIFLFSFVYHLLLFMLGRKRVECLAFALLSIATVALIINLEFTVIVHFDAVAYDLRQRLTWVFMYAMAACFYWFLTLQFDYRRPLVTTLVFSISGFYTVANLFLRDERLLPPILATRDLWIELVVLISLYVVLKSLYRKRTGSVLMLFGVLSAVVGVLLGLTKFQVIPGEIGFVILAVAMAASISRKFTRVEEEIRATVESFRRFVPPAILTRIARQGIGSIKLGGAEEGTSTILFTDIRGFAATAEKLTPTETLEFLNSFMVRMEPVIERHGGFTNQFVGDEIMAIFYSPGQGHDAVKAALDMRAALAILNSERRERGEEEIDAGIGINTGHVIWGTIGSQSRMDSCVIGDTVNLASRLQRLTRNYGVKIIVSETTFREIQRPEDFLWREIDIVQVRGKSQPVVIYEFFETDPDQEREKKKLSLPTFNHALAHYRAADFAAAETLFRESLTINSEDSLIAMYLERCQDFLRKPPPADWRGVTVIDRH